MNDGKCPAFPTTRIERAPGGSSNPIVEVSYPGMSLRDYFAAAALQGMAAGRDLIDSEISFKDVAVWAYHQADAMLEAREK